MGWLDDDRSLMAGGELSVMITGLEGIAVKGEMSVAERAVIYKMITKMTLAVRSLAMTKIPRKTGATQRSIQSDSDPVLLEGHVGSMSKVGLYLEKGTGVHGPTGQRITPHTASMLAWKGGDGTMIFAHSTAGMKARPWLMPAFAEAQSSLFPALMDAAGMEMARCYLQEIRESFGSSLIP